MFKMLLRSLEFIDAKDTDVVVYYSPQYKIFKEAELTFSTSIKIMFIEMEPLNEKVLLDYGYINSIACLQNQNWLKQYTYLLRTDTDTLLTPKWNSHYPECFTIGGGYYVYDDLTRNRLEEVGNKFGINKRADYTENLGSTWYGESGTMLDLSTEVTKLTSYFLKNEFATNEGTWPSYYRGVSLLYASEIAINNMVKKYLKDSENFDFCSTSGNLITNHTHIHCFHTNSLFSKFHFFDGKYVNIDPQNLDLSIVHNYSLYCALTGNTQ
ncbi:hypothetical protein DVR12_03650 [Chitinophaga silvatica]|uniref:DUF7164 domain-containing protein n=2 Tax=Chitinophaga silvatica TaxID=2282649 RepID=A0A3E1YI22_9BACT|nr:hypothetical protein DVR12_03650 [Chitinophaga silvatica]